MTFLIVSNAIVLVVLGAGVYCLLRLGWADRFHHLWFAFGAFTFGPTTTLDLVIRSIALVVACDDAIQHLAQWRQWHTKAAKDGWTKAGASLIAPDEGTGWPGIYRSPLHLAYWWVVTHV